MRTRLSAILAVFVLECVAGAQQQPWPSTGQDPLVTAVAGPSWLSHLGLKLNRTSLGQGAQRYGPGADEKAESPREALGVRQSIPLSGADLYRINCQACHRDDGTGAPPEIKSVLGPVQGSSLSLVRARLHQQHQPAAEETARAEVKRARAQVLTRLHQGGTRMPPRDYLREADLEDLFAYLMQLAATPEAKPRSPRPVTWDHLGEQVVKGTCHICHDATGAKPSGDAVLWGAIPSLQSLLASKPVNEFVHKVRSGAVVSPSDVMFIHRGRMPVFYYLHDEEVAAAFMYLATYPPRATDH